MDQQKQPLTLLIWGTVSQTAVFRTLWLLITAGMVWLSLAAVPLRFQMLQMDVYGYGEGLLASGLTLSFFATYFVAWELTVVFGSIAVGLLIIWQRADDWFATLVSIFLTLFGVLPPLFDGFSYANAQWALPIAYLRFIILGLLMAIFCLFPNGRFQPQWTRWLLLAWLGFSLVIMLTMPEVLADTAVLPNTQTFEDAVWLLVGVAWFCITILGQFLRYRRHATPLEKQQMKLVLFGFSSVVFFSIIGSLTVITFPNINLNPASRTQFTLVMGAVYLISALVIPITIAFSILRYRLWQIDVVINRTLVYGGLTAVILLAYGILVGGFSLLWQAQNNLLISLLATGLIAMLFQPVREWFQRGANRLMFGDRDDPYAVLSKLGSQLQINATPETMLQSVVATVATTLKLPYVAIELVGEGSRLPSASTGKPVAETADFPLRYQNETVGFLVVSPRSPGEPFQAREQQLLNDIAGQAGAAAYSVRLTNALQKSRERLVLTREEERRRIRRDLHDELGPTLASQTFALDAALDLLESDPQAAADLLRSLKGQNKATVADIRRLVYELRPPALDELGMAGALRAHLDNLGDRTALSISLTVQPNPLPSLSAAVEVAAYRIALEGLNNVIKHAQATQCNIELRIENGRSALKVIITDNGVGLLKTVQKGVGLSSMRERAEELGGHFEIWRLAKETRITAVLPLLG